MKLGHLVGSSGDAIYAWARRLVDDLNRTQVISDLPTFENDAAAAAGNVAVLGGYVTSAGIVRRRVA